MKKALQLFVFLMAFQMEVRVRASGDFLEQPSGCFKSLATCALRGGAEGFHMVKDGLKLHVDSGASLMRLAPLQWRLVSGAVWIESGKDLEMETLYATLRSGQGQYWLVEKEGRLLIRNISAELQVTLRDGKKLNVPEGFEFWISGLNTKGVSEYGVLEPVNMREHLLRWSRLYQGSKSEFVKEVKVYRETWGDLTEKSSKLYQTLADREIAAVQERNDRAQSLRQQRALEAKRVKELYHQRVFER